jgi:hypothetical protein
MGIPMWIGDSALPGINDVDNSRAAAAGLACRPAIETIRDTLAWDLARGGPGEEGLTSAEEERLLRVALAPELSPGCQTGAVLDDTMVSDWCEQSLGACVTRVLFRSGNLAQVIGAGLADGRSVVIKVRPFEARIVGCTAAQARLAAGTGTRPRAVESRGPAAYPLGHERTAKRGAARADPPR